MSDDAELLNIFWIEVGEYLRTLNDTLLKVETGTASDLPALLREMNRLAHSMKGAARAVGIGVIETIAHYMEEIFNAALEDKMKLTPEVCDLLYDGLEFVTAKRVNPTRYPLAKPNRPPPLPVPGGHPDNPLGPRALYLGSTLWRIHGTPAPGSIGRAVSNGCIRMLIPQVEWLFTQVDVGTPVFIVAA